MDQVVVEWNVRQLLLYLFTKFILDKGLVGAIAAIFY